MPKQYKRMRRKAPLSRAQAKAVLKLANGPRELKYVDQDHGNLNAQSTAVVTKINPPAQGDGVSSRDGDSYFLKSLQLTSFLNPGSATGNVFRFIVFQWLEDDAADVPVVGDILANTSSANDQVNSFYNINSRKRYRVIYDKKLYIDPNQASGGFKPVKMYTTKIPQRKIILNEAALTGVGNFYMITLGTASSLSIFTGTNTRMRYMDC